MARKKALDIPCGKDDYPLVASKAVSEWMAALARRKARKMTAEQRRALALKMNEARWGKIRGNK